MCSNWAARYHPIARVLRAHNTRTLLSTGFSCLLGLGNVVLSAFVLFSYRVDGSHTYTVFATNALLLVRVLYRSGSTAWLCYRSQMALSLFDCTF